MRLCAEEPCQECGEYGVNFEKPRGHHHLVMRREIIVDYEAAAKEMGKIARGIINNPPSLKHDGIDSQIEGHWVGRIIGAAIGGGVDA